MLSDIYPSQGSFSDSVLSAVDLSIKDYYFTDDGDSYDKHYFVINVRVGSLSFNVDRSYVDFVEFDRRLRKCFPDSAVPTLPLDAANRLQQLITREAAILLDKKRVSGGGGSGGVSGSPAKTFVSANDVSTLPSEIRRSTAKNIFKIPVSSTEIMRQYVDSLTYYLSDITCHHELLTSDLLQVFLDEEIISMFNDVIPPVLTVYDLLLLNSPVNQTIVHRLEEHMFQLPAESMIVWKFFTAQYDIGFSVEMEGMSRLPLTRFNAHEKPICGALETSLPTAAKLVWNNTYAKLYAKQLTWAVRVVHKEQFLEAKQRAMECYKEKKRFEHQRSMLRLSSCRQATMISRVMHGDITMELYEESFDMALKLTEARLESLQQSNAVLLKDLGKAEIRLNEVENVAEHLQDSKARVSNTLTTSVQELEELRAENADLHGAIVELQDQLRSVLDLEKYCQESLHRMATMKNDVIELAGHLRELFAKFREEYVSGSDYFDRKENQLQDILTATEAEADGDDNGRAALEERLKQFIADLLDDSQDKNDAWYKLINQFGLAIEKASSIRDL